MTVSRVSNLLRIFTAMAVTVVLGSGPAAAHWGHLADLGGHAHWAGLALGAAAAALAAGLAVAGRANDEDEDASLASEDTQGDPSDA